MVIPNDLVNDVSLDCVHWLALIKMVVVFIHLKGAVLVNTSNRPN